MTDLARLLERVRAATGPDHELDALICAAVGYMPDCISTDYVADPSYAVSSDDAARLEARVYGYLIMARPASPITSSIDVALALVEKLLPGDWWGLLELAVFGDHMEYHPQEPIFSLEKLPLAILAALLSALVAKESAHD